MYIEISDLDRQLQLTEEQQSKIIGGERERLGACANTGDGQYICVPDMANVDIGNLSSGLQAAYFIPDDPSYPDSFFLYSDFTIEAN